MVQVLPGNIRRAVLTITVSTGEQIFAAVHPLATIADANYTQSGLQTQELLYKDWLDVIGSPWFVLASGGVAGILSVTEVLRLQ